MSKGGGSSGNTSTTTSTTAPNPQFAQAYQNLTDRAFNVADQPLQQYTGPLVAGMTPQQQQGYQTIQNLQGAYAPYLNAGAQEISQSTAPIWSGLPSFDTSQLPGGALDRINQSSDFATAAGTQPIAQQTAPYAGFAGETAQGLAGQVSPFTGFAAGTAGALPGQIAPYTGIAADQARGLPGQVATQTGQVSGIAGGLQGQAGAEANLANTAARSAPGNIATYQNPYTQNVTDALTKLFNQQNAEQLAQQRGSTVGAGAYGGDRQSVSEALLGKQQQLAEAPTLANVQQQGYQQAVQAAQQEAALRAQTGLGAGQLQTQAGIGAGQLGLGAAGATTQAAGTAGQLGLGAAGATTQAGLGAGQLGLGAGQLTSQTGLGAGQLGLGAGQLTGQSLAQQGQLGLGAGQLDLAGGQGLFNEFNQQQAAQQQADTTNRWLSQGAGYGLASLGSQAQTLGLQGAQAEIGAGQQQQQLAQQQLNIPYEQFLQRQNYPYQQLNFLAPIVEGTGSMAGGTSSTSVPGPSTGSQLLGLGAAGAGLYGATGGFNNLFGTQPSSSGGGPGDWSGTGGGEWSSDKDGGRVGLAAGGLPGMALPLESGVPDVSVGMVPALTGNARSPLVASLASPQTSTTTSGGGGGGGSGGSGIGSTLLGLAGTVAGAYFGGPVGAYVGGTAGRAIGSSLKEGGLAGGGEPAEANDGTAALDTQEPLANPLKQASYERYASMPEEKLRELTVSIPQGSQQGQMIRRALQQKQMGTQPAPQTPQNLPSTYLPLQSKGLEGYAKGGSDHGDTVSEEDMDPQPVVDHSGPTVVIHYPSEKHSLDLGIPSSPDRPGFAIGGTPAGPLKIDPIGHLSTTSKPGTPTNFELPPVQSPSFVDFTKSPTGVSIPSIKPLGMFSPPGFNGLNTMDTGGGYGNWFAPQAQLIPSGGGFANAPPGGGPPPSSNPSPPIDPTNDPSYYITPMYAAGGRTGLAAGGQGTSQGLSGGDLGPTGVPHISLDYMMAPGPVVRGPGPPKPPPASQGAEPSGLDPAKILSTVKTIGGLSKGLAGKDGEDGLAAGGLPDDDEMSSDTRDVLAAHDEAFKEEPKPTQAPKAPPKEEPGPPRPPAQGLEGTTSLPYAEQAMGLSPVAQVAKAVKSAGYNRDYTPGSPQDPDLAFRQIMALRGDTSLMPQEKPAPPINDVSGVQEAATPETVIPSKPTAKPPAGAPAPSPAGTPPVEAAKPPAPESKAEAAKPPDVVQTSQIGAIPKLITEKAAAYGVPPSAATRFAQLESGMGQNLGTRGNVYQLGPNEWARMGGGDMRDTETNIDRGVKYVAHDYEVARAKLGREPQEIEAYMVHQQGDAGGPALLAAPNASAVDVLTQANGGNRQAAQQAIIQNMGDLSMTAGQFVALQKSRLEGVKPNLSASQLVFHGGAPDPLVRGPQGGQPGVERTGYMVPTPSTAQGVPIPEPHQYEPGAGANPWLALAAAGLGTMAGRSPFALQNIGTGGLEGVKVLQQQEAEKMKTAQIANEAANRQATLGLEKAKTIETEHYHGGELADRQQQLQINQQNADRALQAANQRFEVEIGRNHTQDERAKILDDHYADIAKHQAITDGVNAQYRAMMMAKPIPGRNEQGQSGNFVFNPQSLQFEFHPGETVTRGPTSTAGERLQQQLIASGAAGDESVPYAQRLTRAIELSRNPQQQAQFIEREAQQYAHNDATNAALTNPGKPFDLNASYQAHRAKLQEEFGQGGTKQPTATGAQAQAAPQWTRDHPFESKSPADIADLPPGSVVKTPDGRLMVKP